ncbi:site-specific DNA-methyltransferase [Trichococcus ilyis]|uniref:Adenine-specific DNA-methyltransferase n=1 Tax=Trichococcus ilyis TaxID=640938 RepID=A0A143Z5A0_9LACT|nr:site-specific DNA-methyltransferase [Trichococcus ilyis]CZR07797.1 n-6 adenine-specific dna methylases signature [Trichococcus ilyis]SEJ82698.1 adenine-specific DNA-methyltransferase [Trichococcus ilyis]
METKINQEIHTALRQFEDRYFIDGIVNKQRVIQDLYNYDSELIAAMLNSDLLKENFTMQVADTTIFQINNLIELFEADEFWKDSYTKYSKKIGLSSGGKFIDETTDVVLDFPYKDTVLKASMSKEDTDKEDLRPEEPFLNEVIAKEEIDVLLDKKIFVNTKRYSVEGEEEIDRFTDDNLIIKGNNLLALQVLKEQYEGKVKLIYIDPPYNTGGDSFKYNDRFNHSTWLTFMKNRLEIAKELLSDDGSIWINIDDDEGHYLKVLADGIFGRDNFINTIIWEKKYTISNDAKFFSDNHDLILVYGKSKQDWIPNKLSRTEKMNAAYKNPDNHPKGLWKATPLHAKSGSDRAEKFEYQFKNGVVWTPPEGTYPRFSIDTLKKMDDNNEIWFGKDGTAVPSKKTFLLDLKNDGTPSRTVWRFDEVGHNHEARDEVKKLNSDFLFSTPKPERLIQKILHIGSCENDMILDFFMGSATTQAVAMKMNRKFIGIEQMDYVNTISIPRLQKVIEGEQGGISKDVSWQGGGSFVYAELMEKNTGFLHSIMSAKSMTELQEIFNRMLETTDFDFRVNLDEVRNTIWRLSVEDQKRTLVKIIDKNQLYYNYSEIDDINVRDLISDTDYAFNQSYYAERGE